MSTMKIFVSHSHQNNEFCAKLVHALRTAGADVWYDHESLHTGQLGPVIEHELRERPVFIVALSPAALASRWVEDETRWAYNRLRRDPTRIILPVTAEALPDADAIWLFLQDFRRIEAPGGMPYPISEAISQTLHALLLTLPEEEALPTTPQPGESVVELLAQGKALVAQDRFAEAIPFFERVTQRDPLRFDAWANLGLAYNETGRHGDDLIAYNRALALDDTQAWVWHNKGNALADDVLQLYEEALEAYDRAVALDSTLSNAWAGKGVALLALKRYEEALAAVDQAVALDPTLLAAWPCKGQTLLALKRYEEAVAAFDRAIALDPKEAPVWIFKAEALRELGRTAEAEEAERRAKELGEE